MPPLMVPDEVAHLFRAYLISEGRGCIANPDVGVPEYVNQLMTQFPTPAKRRFTARELIGILRTSPQGERRAAGGYVAVNLYSCVPYLPAAAAIGVGRKLGVSALGLLYLGRFGNLAAYAGLIFVALRLMPDLRWLLFSIALMPMTLHQAASLSADSFTFATAFLLSAYVLHLAFGPEPRVRLQHQLILAGLVLLVSFCKFNIWLVLLVALIPPRKFADPWRRWAALAAQIAVAIAAAGAWQYFNQQNIQLFASTREVFDIYVAHNLQFVVQHPLIFASAVGRAIRAEGFFDLYSIVGNLGWLELPLPVLLVWGYFALLLAIALTQSRIIVLPSAQKLLLGVAVVGAVLSTYVLLWTFDIQQSYLNRDILAGRGQAVGIQGRYLIVLLLPAFLIFVNEKTRVPWRPIGLVAILYIFIVNAAGLVMVANKYYGG